MEPENTPLEKENHLPNHHFQVLWCSMLVSGSVYIYIFIDGKFHNPGENSRCNFLMIFTNISHSEVSSTTWSCPSLPRCREGVKIGQSCWEYQYIYIYMDISWIFQGNTSPHPPISSIRFWGVCYRCLFIIDECVCVLWILRACCFFHSRSQVVLFIVDVHASQLGAIIWHHKLICNIKC